MASAVGAPHAHGRGERHWILFACQGAFRSYYARASAIPDGVSSSASRLDGHIQQVNAVPLFRNNDAVGYNPDSYPKPGVPHGKLSEKHTITSKIYDGMKSDYWVYASPGVDPNVPAPLMVWQDGQGLTGELSGIRLITVTENLVQQGLLPPIVHVMIAPGTDRKSTRLNSSH